VRPIFGKKNSNSICLGSSLLHFSKIELIERKNKKVKKNIVPLNRLNELPKDVQTKVKEKLKVINKSLPIIHKINFKSPCIMGILNITPDSFYDGGEYFSKKLAIEKYRKMLKEGAKIIDIGGESTRPGAKRISVDEEMSRVIPVITEIRKKNKKSLISLDTRKPQVMGGGIRLGVNFINDVSGLRYNKKTLQLLKKNKTPFILMHSISSPENMQKKIKYDDVLLDVYDFFEKQIEKCKKASIDPKRIIIDPGIGFGKTVKQNLNLISNISLFHSLGFPILLGASRKSFIGKLSKNALNNDCLGGSIATVLFALSQGVQIFRVHDVHETNQAIKVFTNI
jgi:dihydropteroate synthase